MAATLNGHPILPYNSPILQRLDGFRLMFPRPIKPTPGLNVKGLNIAQIKRNPDYPVDRGALCNLLVQTCEFERVVVFENPSKLSLLFKCKAEDEKATMFCDFVRCLQNKTLAEITASPTHYPKEFGKPTDRFRPILKEDEYQGRITYEVRAELSLNGDNTPKDTMLFEMLEDGPAVITMQDFMEKYKNRKCVAIIEFSYMTIMNSGTKAISIKPMVKQLLLLPESKRADDAMQDNNTFRFMDL